MPWLTNGGTIKQGQQARKGENMTENEFILQDRLAKIQAVLGKYGASNFYVSFSGGKDSTVLHHLIDMAEPENRIPRVYADTGIEYKKWSNMLPNCKSMTIVYRL